LKHHTELAGRSHLKTIKSKFEENSIPILKDLLSGNGVQAIVMEEVSEFRKRIFSPLETLWIFITQVLSADHSCRSALSKFILTRTKDEEKACSFSTGAYCKARARLPLGLIQRLTRYFAECLTQNVPSDWTWHGKNVKLVDGTTLSMPDTLENQKKFPQIVTQKKGLGFPMARVVVLASLSCGAILDIAVSAYKGKGTGEPSLLRTLMGRLKEKDLLLFDRYYTGFFDLGFFLLNKVDFVTRQNERRTKDFRQGKRLGKNDRIIKLIPPRRSRKPFWVDDDLYDQISSVKVREIRVQIRKNGFRTKIIYVITSLLDPKTYPKEDIAQLYRARWNIEIDLDSIKTDLGMNILRCKTPVMIEKEIWTHLLTYNLIRVFMCQSAVQHGLNPREISFKAALQIFESFRIIMSTANSKDYESLHRTMITLMRAHKVGNRPNRYEPRVLKRRQSRNYMFLTIPRDQARKRFWKRPRSRCKKPIAA